MNRRDFLKGISTAGIIAGLGQLPVRAAYKLPRPNLLFVMADQFRSMALGVMDADPVITPNFDRFARQGQVLTNVTSSYPVCTPFRAMLMTGRFPMSTGMTFNCLTGLNMRLREGEVCFGDALKGSGYRTGYVGKYHLDVPLRDPSEPAPEGVDQSDIWTPPGLRRHGFDFWYAYNTGREHFKQNYWTGSSPKKIIKERVWSVDHETDVALDFIKKQKDKPDKPFALFVSWNPPHPRYVAPRDIIDKYDSDSFAYRSNVQEDCVKNLRLIQRNYFSAVTSCDENFGRLLDELDVQGLTDNTVVVFTSDHGEMLGSQGKLKKDVWYEEAVNIPFLLRWSSQVKNCSNDMLLGPFDIMPTLLSLMDIQPPLTCEGRDYSAAIKGEACETQSSIPLMHIPCPGADRFWPLQNPVPWVETGANLSRKGYDWRVWGYRGLRTKRYTYIVDRSINAAGYEYSGSITGIRNQDKVRALPDYKGPESYKVKYFLYDRQEDPYQMNPVIAENINDNEQMKILNKELADWLKRMRDPFPV